MGYSIVPFVILPLIFIINVLKYHLNYEAIVTNVGERGMYLVFAGIHDENSLMLCENSG